MATSYRQVSTSQPCPVVLARSRQASRPTVPVSPLMLSISDTPTRVGGPSGSPVSSIRPASACIRKS